MGTAGVEYDIGRAPQIDVRALVNDTAADLHTKTAADKSNTAAALEDDTGDNLALVRREPEPGSEPETTATAVGDGHMQEGYRLSRLFPNSIHTSDMKHIADNLLSECLESMEMWESLLDGLRACEKLLAPPTMRERFQACCCDGNAMVEKQFATWSHSLKSLRWEAIELFTKELLALECPLRIHWCKKKFMSGNGDTHKSWHQSDSGVGINVEAIDRAISSPSFWGGVAMIHDLSFSVEFLGRWAEGCPCCEDALLEGKGVKRRRTKWLQHVKDANTTPCPFSGCRAVEIAAGQASSCYLNCLNTY